MLFSDMEGSTRLLARLGDQYGELLSIQRSLQRAAYRRHHGVELGTEGDSFFVAFGSAADAVAACAEAQQSLAHQDWPGGAVPRIRMGVHTGEPTRHDDGYIGMDVHRAARIAAAAHGGQVVLSDATWQLVAGQLPGLRAADLGWHRLKDITEPEHLHQLLIDGLAAEFPPLRTLGQRASLPRPPTPMLARDHELSDLTGLITGPEAARLVTLTGPGGVGKSRLALALAQAVDQHYGDGVYFVPLAAVRDPAVMWSSIADRLGVTGDGRSPPTFFEHVSGREALIILDNLEQLAAAGEVVAELVAAAPRITVLATSRSPLRVPGEQEYPVAPLPVAHPAGPDGPWDGAVELFTRHARMVRPAFALTESNFADVVAICDRLDGLPLAIELAAARTRVLSPKALLARLGGSLEFEAGSAGRPDRQRTLRSTIAWSYDLLSPDLQRFFRRISVFSGGAGLDAIEAVIAGPGDPLDNVTALVESSLAMIRDGQGGDPRLGLLQTIRVFAAGRLEEAGEADEARHEHAAYFTQLAERIAPDLQGPRPLKARDQLDADLDNMRAALAWSLDPAGRGTGRSEIGLRLCQALSWFWYAFGYQQEGRGWLRQATEAAGQGGPELAGPLHGLAVLLLQQGEATEARQALETCLAIWRRENDLARIAAELCSLGVANWTLGDEAAGRALLTESVEVARTAGDEARMSTALTNLAVLEVNDHPQRAIELLRQALDIDTRQGNTWGQAVVQTNLAGAMLQAGQPQAAYDHLREHAAQLVGLGDIELTINVIESLSCAFAQLGFPPRAARLLGTAEALREQAGLPRAEPDQALLDELVGPARDRLGPQQWAGQYQSGRPLTPAAALADAGAIRPG
jgi:predicted ATPase/class 3 adenylate cyclase